MQQDVEEEEEEEEADLYGPCIHTSSICSI